MNHRSFALENLETRTLLSAVAPMDDAPVDTATPVDVITLAAATHSPFSGAFNAAGKFTKPLGNPDAGATYNFTGSGKTKSLGSFTLTGHAQGPGFVANGRTTGQLVLTTSKGTLTLSVAGPHQSPGSLPASLSFSIVKGTGSYTKSTGKGTIAVSASNTTHKFLFIFRPST